MLVAEEAVEIRVLRRQGKSVALRNRRPGPCRWRVRLSHPDFLIEIDLVAITEA